MIATRMRQAASSIAGAIVYLFRDEFITPDAAPITSPRTAEPGPGTISFTDAGNIESISGGNLVISGTASGGSTGFFTTTFTRVAGRALVYNFGALVNGGISRLGWATSFGSGENIGVSIVNPTNIQVREQVANPTIIMTMPSTLMMVLRSTGFFLVNGTKLLWVARTINTSNIGANMWIGGGQTPNMSIVDLSVTDIVDMDADGKVYTSYVASPTSGQTTTMTAEGIVTFDWTPVAAETLVIMFRRTDDNNTLKIECNQAAGTIRFYKREAGVDTEFVTGTTTQTWTAGVSYHIVIRTIGTGAISYVNNVVRNQPAGQTFNQSATGVKVAGFTTGSNLYCWPYDVSALIPPALVPT